MSVSPRQLLREGAANSWAAQANISLEVGAAFAAMAEELRRLQDSMAGSRPSIEASVQAEQLLRRATQVLAPFQVGEDQQLAGRLFDVQGRGQSLIPSHVIDSYDEVAIAGRVRFGRYYLGGNGAVHGGALPLLFDELLGWLAASGRDRLRTAYLHIDYRSVTPIERELSFVARFAHEEGRKVTMTGSIHDGRTLLVEAEGLFVKLRPDQP